jgi:UDP-hydrolysing UDP-N-acetyl-D-glucosamine 2-epimerase
MMKKRKICIVTGSRAEYGLLYWLMREIQDDSDLELQIIVTGMHLSPEYGLTYRLIEEDGFSINEKIEMLLSSDTPVGIAKSIGLATISFADALDRLMPDIIVLLGDRYEILAAAQTAMVSRIPIAHLHGGETTEGMMDEAIRHSVTKMAHLHFVAAETYRERVIQLGEDPKRVMNFGAPGIENIFKMDLLNREEFEESIDWKLGKINFLVTYHPVTVHKENPAYVIQELFMALDQIPEANIIFTKSNSDTDGRIINQMIDEYTSKQPHRAKAFTSLGQLRYLSAILHVDAVVGNSSSGLIEVPVFKKPTINVGYRQSGRLRADSVIDSLGNSKDIIASLRKALSPEFQQILKKGNSPYGHGKVSIRIKNYLKEVNLKNILVKKFYDFADTKE